MPLRKTLCSTFCFYYKPDKNEELACKGHDVVERLIRQGRAIPFERSGREVDCSVSALLAKKMCMTCDFHEQDCDFMQNRAKPPCGGFVLLAQLLMSGEITLEDIDITKNSNAEQKA